MNTRRRPTLLTLCLLTCLVAGTARSAAPLMFLTGSPEPQALAGAPYLFEPSVLVQGTSGEVFSFEASNLPSWMRFDAATGRIWGVPRSTDAGFYEDITLSLVSGPVRISLQPFSILVYRQLSADTAGIAWTLPTTNSDDSPYVDPAGYVIYAGPAPDALRPLVHIFDPHTTQFTASNLPVGTTYFAITSFNRQGIESSLSSATAQYFR